MSDEQDKLKVSLEPPKLFGRKKKSDKAAGDNKSAGSGDEASGPQGPAEPENAREPEREPVQPAPTEPDAVEPQATTPAAQEAPDEEQPVEEAGTPERPEVPEERPDELPEAGIVPDTEPVVEPEAEGEPETEGEPEVEGEPETEHEPEVEGEPETEHEPEVESKPETEHEPEAAEDQHEPSFVDKLRSRFSNEPAAAEVSDADAEDAEITSGAYTAPLLSTYSAATVAGGLVGLGLVVLTWLSLRGCEAISDACSSGANFFLLIAIFVVSVMIGSAILKSFSVPDPGSTSFLAVGLVAVISLLLLVDVLDHWSMLIVIPVVSVGGFLLSAYITKTFVEPDDS